MPSEIHTASCRDDRSHLRRNMQPPVYRRMGSFGCTVFPSGLFGQALTVKGETEGFDIFDFKLRYYNADSELIDAVMADAGSPLEDCSDNWERLSSIAQSCILKKGI